MVHRSSGCRIVGATYIPATMNTPPLIVGGGAELFDVVVHMHGLRTFSEESPAALGIRLGSLVIPVIPLDRVIASKKALGRPKDRAILPALEDALRTLERRDG